MKTPRSNNEKAGKQNLELGTSDHCKNGLRQQKNNRNEQFDKNTR